MTNDPIMMIKQDHRTVEALFKQYEELGADELEDKEEVLDEIIVELSTHAEIEETLCYPRFRQAFTNSSDEELIDEAYAEHSTMKSLLNELTTMESTDPALDAKVEELKKDVLHHVQEEENEILPQVEEEVEETELAALGEEMIAFKETRSQMVP
jgi:hemerythrin superfamily protein